MSGIFAIHELVQWLTDRGMPFGHNRIKRDKPSQHDQTRNITPLCNDILGIINNESHNHDTSLGDKIANRDVLENGAQEDKFEAINSRNSLIHLKLGAPDRAMDAIECDETGSRDDDMQKHFDEDAPGGVTARVTHL